METITENNSAAICGEIARDFEFSHETCGERFFQSEICAVRASGTADTIPVIVSERLIDMGKGWGGKTVRLSGQFRSHNVEGEGKKKLILYLFVTDVDVLEDELNPGKMNENFITLNGFICKKPSYRKTPGGREITDILLAVNRRCRKSDYIPCIAWGRNAAFASGLEVGTKLKISGRMQSREYFKMASDGVLWAYMAYEVSIGRLDVIDVAEG